jgi:hypothetical protein
MKCERDFLRDLEYKAKEQGKLVKTELMPGWARGLGDWLAINPWRVLVPVAALTYILLRISGGSELREFILGLFGGFAR